ncbi:MAG TPA: carbohydrate porin [Candidatus Omnitrophota bacterium]|nr:carbohydrate porin [Candidatus Omnitrophota bacterium]
MKGSMRRVVFAGVFVIGLCCAQSVGLAGSAVSNDQLADEIRELKKTVQQQQRRISELEQRVAQQESVARSTGEVMPVSEIDRRIDERLSSKAPAYQLMEGLALSAGATTVVQGAHHANGASQLSSGEDVFDASVSADITLEKKFEEYGEGVVYLTSGQGAGVEDELQLYSNVNNDADNDQNARLAEVWYEHYIHSISGAVAFGKLDATNYIDTNAYANDETTQFLGRMFRNSPVIEFPSNGAGVHFGASPLDFFDVNLVALDADADWEDVFDGLFVAGQLTFKPRLFAREGKYRILVWNNGANHTQWTDAGKDKENNYGWGLSFDQELNDVVGVFMRYGWQDPKVYANGSAFSIEHSWSVGPQIKGSLWGRPDDCLGLSFGQITPSGKYKTTSGVLAKTESHFEGYYNFKVNDHLCLSPDLQVIWRPYGKDAANGDGTIVVAGMRGQMDF